jgi:hypothetical protein
MCNCLAARWQLIISVTGGCGGDSSVPYQYSWREATIILKVFHVSLLSVSTHSLFWPALGVLLIMVLPHSSEKPTQYFVTYNHSVFAIFR